MTTVAGLEVLLDDVGVPWERADATTLVVTLPGERKLRTTCSLTVGTSALTVNAFVSRRPDENQAAVYRWLLEQNRRLYALAFSLDHLGDIYLTGRVALTAVTPEELDRILGCVLEYSDSSFNTILELGFASAIRREWEWRTEKGLPIDNLAAFAHLLQPLDPGA
jgi:hypothetical protein